MSTKQYLSSAILILNKHSLLSPTLDSVSTLNLF